ncbi:MAG TPA: hypothetical protein DIT99_18265, partial [Candidatus Latescibacteria bacterium]|nr:hypothetical protein [Candidatus Latescibacterota bacterium]
KTDQYYQFSLLHHPDARKIFAESRPKLYPYEDTGKVVRVLSELLESSSKSRCKFVIYPRMKNKEQIERFIREKAKNVYAPCYIPRSLITVLPDGQVIPCLSLGLGNVRDHGYDIRDVLKNDRYKGFLDIISSSTELPAACNVCCFAKVRG